MNDRYWCKKGHFNLDQSEFFKETVYKQNPKFVLEIGFCTGRSAYSVIKFAKDLIKMISIDVDFDYIKPEGNEFRKLFEKDFARKFKTIEKSSHDILNKDFFEKEYPNGLDWVTIDGDHSYKGCKKDLDDVKNYINIDGIIIVDDYMSGPPNGCKLVEVNKACDDFGEQNPNFEKQVWNKRGKGFCIFKRIT